MTFEFIIFHLKTLINKYIIRETSITKEKPINYIIIFDVVDYYYKSDNNGDVDFIKGS